MFRKAMMSAVMIVGVIFASSAFALFTSSVADIASSFDEVLGFWSRPKYCTLHLKQLEGKEIPSFVGEGLLFRANIACDGQNVVSTSLLRDSRFTTVEEIYTELLPKFYKRKQVLKLNIAEQGGMTYLFVRQ